MAQVSLPYTLTAGTPENVNNLVANLNALVAGVNTIDTAQLASGSVSQAKLAAGVYVPIGGIVQYGGSSAPSNWVLCDGSAISRTTYADLFTALGTSYGSGDGSTTFNVPNLKGRAAVGRDAAQTEFDVLGETGGAKTHTLTKAEMPSHDHGGSTGNDSPDHTHSQNGDGSIAYSLNSGGSTTVPNGSTQQTGGASARHTHSISSEGSDTAHNNLQPYIVLNYIIRAL